MRHAIPWEIRRDFTLREVNPHDLQGCDALLPELTKGIGALIADKAYDALERVVEVLERDAVEAVIPPRNNRKEKRRYDMEKYKWRHLMENMFQKMKQFRGIATRYDKLAESYLGGIYLVASLI